MMRFGRYSVSAVVALALVASAPPTSAGAAPPPEVDVSHSPAEPSAKPLPPGAVTPVRGTGRWFAITQHEVRNSLRAKASKGRQSLIKITGPHARQRFAFDVAMPAGSRLAMRGTRIAALTERGVVSGVLETPWAVDALGVKVATRFEIIDRDTFVQVVEHRAVGATYPVYADPWWVVAVVLAREGTRQVGRYVVRRSTYEAAKRAAAKLAAKEQNLNIDDLLAKTPVKLRKLTARNFRENVRRRTAWSKESIKGYDAHHTLPKKFEADFKRAGLNIHNPIFGHWWCASAHRSAAAAYNRKWNRWLSTRSDDITNSASWRNTIESKRLSMVSTPKWANTYQCP